MTGHGTTRRATLRGAALLACAALGLTSCGGEEPAAAPGPVTLEFWYMPDGAHPGKAIGREAELFEQANPGVRVELVQVPWEEALTRLTTAAASGEGPDATQVGSTWVAGLAAQDAFRPVSDADLAAVGGRDAFLDASWHSTQPLGAERPVAVPWLVDTRVLFYRTDVLAAAGLDPATAFATFESFEATLTRLQEHTGKRPLGFPGVNDWNVVHNAAPWVYSSGGNILDASGRAVQEQGTLDGIHRMQRLVGTFGDQDILNRTDSDAKDGFARGDYPLIISGPYTVPVLADEATAPVVRENWSTAELPAGPAGRIGFLGGSNLAVSAHAEHPAEALRWITWLSSPESQRRMTASGGLLPAVRAAVTASDPRTAAIAAAAEHGRQYPPASRWIDVEAQLQHDLSNLWGEVMQTGGPLPHERVAELVTASAQQVGELTAP
ncbi:sugar ABC transporter substrate-binding protein [Kineococcus sp. NUM-3379]